MRHTFVIARAPTRQTQVQRVNVQMPTPSESAKAVLTHPHDLMIAYVPPAMLCDTGLQKLLLGHTLARLSRQSAHQPMKIMWVCDDPHVPERLLRRWLGSVLKIKKGVELPNGSELHLCPMQPFKRPPVRRVDEAVIDGAHLMLRSTFNSIRVMTRGRLTVVSEPTAGRHWLDSLQDESKASDAFQPAPHVRVTWEDGVAHGSYAGEPEGDARQYEALPPAPTARKPLLAFARDRLYVRSKEGVVKPFDLWVDQKRYLAHRRLAMTRSKQQGLTQALILVLKSRRRGITTIEQADSYERAATIHESRCLTLAQTDKDTRKIFDIAKRFLREDPEAPEIGATGNQSKLLFPGLQSEFTIATAGATAPGRGDTLDKVHGSEVSRWCNRNIERVDELMSGLTEAASHGVVIAETTPAGWEWFAQKWTESKAGGNDWHRIFLRWFDDANNSLRVDDPSEIIDNLEHDEVELVAKHDLSAEQLAWRRAAKRRLRILFPQEYPEDDVSCFLMSGTPYFDLETVMGRLKRLGSDAAPRKHVRTKNGRGYYIQWAKPESGVQYDLGCDTSEGLHGCDLNGFTIIRHDTGEDVFALHGLFRPKDLGELIVKWAKVYGKCMVGIERENHGHAALQAVTDLGWTAPHKLYHFKDGRAGWSTNSETRPKMLEDLAVFVEENPEKIKDRDFLQECTTFKLQDNGRFEADTGCHDDCVMKRAVANAMRRHRRRPGTIRTRSLEDYEEQDEKNEQKRRNAANSNGRTNGRVSVGEFGSG